jgi:hypothetical protein
VNPPFKVGDKVICIKDDMWKWEAGHGKQVPDNHVSPTYGNIYTVKEILQIENYENFNVGKYAMTLQEIPDSIQFDGSFGENVYSCRRFEKGIL